jgi:hypothetical protein
VLAGGIVAALFSDCSLRRGKNLFLDLAEFSMLPLATNPTMDRLAQLGRYFFAIPFAAFGVQYFLYGHYSGGLSPVAPWAGGAAIAVLANLDAGLACLLLGLMFFLWTVLLRPPRVAIRRNNGDEWSNAFTALAMAGASFLLPLFPART